MEALTGMIQAGMSDNTDLFMHIGVHKTGSTALQQRLESCSEILADNGINYLGKSVFQYHASLAFLRKKIGWDATDERAAPQKWKKLRRMATECTTKALISSEAFCEADAQKVRALKKIFDSKNIKIIISVRPIGELLPSSWQQYVKTGMSDSYTDWLDNVLNFRKVETTPSFWRRNNFSKLISKWGNIFGMDNLAIIVVNSSDHENLYRNVEYALGLPSQTLINQGEGNAPNRSLAWEEVELIRMLNAACKDKLRFDVYHKYFRRGAIVALQEHPNLRPLEPIQTPKWAIQKANLLSQGFVDFINLSGVQVFGDLTQLSSVVVPPDNIEQPQINAISTEAVISLLEGLLKKINEGVTNLP